MYLNDRLQICLLALDSRYPDHVVDINEAVFGSQVFGSAGWTAHEVIGLLQQVSPERLQAMARLVLNSQKCVIYLPEHSEHIPAIHIHCRGKLPERRWDRNVLCEPLGARG